MKKNVGSVDRSIRLLIAAIIVILYFTNVITGVLGIVLLALAGIFVIVAVVGCCPLYLLGGWSTRHVDKVKKA